MLPRPIAVSISRNSLVQSIDERDDMSSDCASIMRLWKFESLFIVPTNIDIRSVKMKAQDGIRCSDVTEDGAWLYNRWQRNGSEGDTGPQIGCPASCSTVNDP